MHTLWKTLGRCRKSAMICVPSREVRPVPAAAAAAAAAAEESNVEGISGGASGAAVDDCVAGAAGAIVRWCVVCEVCGVLLITGCGREGHGQVMRARALIYPVQRTLLSAPVCYE